VFAPFVPHVVRDGVVLQVFAGSEFFPMASLTTTVPVLSVGGIAKEFLVPGWRVGWIIVYDRNDLFAVVRCCGATSVRTCW
jgi:aspartate/methionine/tyrosine aminotransferase